MQLNSQLINRFYNTSSSASSFAGNLLRFLFKNEDLEGKNAYGYFLPKDCCDPAVIEEVRKIVMKKYKDADRKKLRAPNQSNNKKKRKNICVKNSMLIVCLFSVFSFRFFIFL